MARAGRKRKHGARHPGGQLVKVKKLTDAEAQRIRTSRQPHRRALRTDDRLDERGESLLGRLLLRHWLRINPLPPGSTAPMTQNELDRYDAGLLYLRTVGAFRSTLEGPSALAGSGAGSQCDAIACLAQHGRGDGEVDCACDRARDRYERVRHRLRHLPQASHQALESVVLRGAAIAPQDRVYLIRALDELVQFYGLTERRRERDHRNANSLIAPGPDQGSGAPVSAEEGAR